MQLLLFCTSYCILLHLYQFTGYSVHILYTFYNRGPEGPVNRHMMNNTDTDTDTDTIQI